MKKSVLIMVLLIIVTSLTVGCEKLEIDPEVTETEEVVVLTEDSTDNAQFLIDENFKLINNMWSAKDQVNQSIIEFEDGSYGWTWKRGASSDNGPNYPEVLLGVKPWGSHEFTTGVLPLQLDEIDSLQLELDIEYEVYDRDHEFDLAFEMWLTEEKPGSNVRNSITDEIMIWFDWQEDLWDWEGLPYDDYAVNDGYNDYHYNAYVSDFGGSDWVGGGWEYSQFRIADKGTIPQVVNLKPFLDRIKAEHGKSGELWVGALEFGMEYGDNSAGIVRIKNLNYIINGHKFESGLDQL
jgi:hypothetical protein